MIHLPALVFLTVLELLVVFAALWLVWFFKSRKLARQLAATQTRLAKPQTEANAAAYFAAELQSTQAQIDRQAEGDPQALTALALRSAYLDVERELAQGQLRDPAFWSRAQDRITALLAQQPAVASESAVASGDEVVYQQNDEEDSVRVKLLFDAQIATINELKEALAALAGDNAEGQSMLAQLDKISRTNREMSMCVSILEDDNTFLREQISALVHTD